ncbi:MAG: CRISPR-associated endonuclease Cas2 [Planctomycetes bacterium]|nr:CRISPR-associated endonuclease Cas2 [Planctomycetota bacterium]
MDWLIAYDIAHPRRLRRVARLLEKRAVRCQYSVFLFQGERSAVVQLLDEIARLLRAREDVVQAWPVAGQAAGPDLARGCSRPVRPAGVVLAGGQVLWVPYPWPKGPTS